MRNNLGRDDTLTGLDGQVVAVFHAHPDDEVFATAAATHALAAAGAHVRLFIATGGELPEQGADPSLDEAAARAVRERRLQRSCSLLGIRHWSYLTRPGQWIDSTDPSRTLAGATGTVVAAAVRTVIDNWRPQIVLSVGPDGLTGHPDHVAMHDAVATALRMPGWSPRHAWGATMIDSAVRCAQAALDQQGPDAPQQTGHQAVTGIAPARIDRSIHSPGVEAKRRRAMDEYLEGLGSWPIDRLINTYRLRGASLSLRAVFDTTSWEADHFVRL